MDCTSTLLPSTAGNIKLYGLLEILAQLESVLKTLLNDKTTIADTHALFDAMVEEERNTAHRLSADGEIVLQVPFEKAMVKLQENGIVELSSCEKLAIERLQILQ